MDDIDWDAQVQVKMLVPDFVKWDGLSLTEAVKRCMGLPPSELANVSIFAPSGIYDRKQIESLFLRLPHSN